MCFPGAKAVGLAEIFNDFDQAEETGKLKKANNYDVTKESPYHSSYS